VRPASSHYRQVHLLVLVAYILLALIMTFPLAERIDTHVPGDGIDAPPLAWNLWWVKYSLVDLGHNPFDCDYLFYPIKINLAFYTLTVLNGAISIPLQGVLGLIAASNLILLSSYVIGAYGVFLLLEHLLAQTFVRRKAWPNRIYLAAFVGGFLYAFASSKLFFAALGQFNIASSQWIPFYILFLFKMRQSPGRVLPPIMAGLFLLLQVWAEMTFASFLVIFTLIFFLYHLFSGQRSQSLHRFLLGLLAVVVIAGIGIAPILAMMLPDLTTQGNFMVEGSGFAEDFSSDIQGWVIPTQLHPLLGGWVGQFAFPHDKGQHLFLGYVTLLIAIYGVVVCRRRGVVRFWVLSTLGFLLLTLGPAARFNGAPILDVPLPFVILQRLPLFNGNRYPGRISVMVVLGLAVLVGFGTWELLQQPRLRARLQPAHIAAVLVILLGLEHLSLPLPMVDLRAPEVYRQIGQDPTDGTVLDVPVAWRNGFRVAGTMDPIIMFEQFYQTTHHKRILAGNTSRNPTYKFQYFTEMPVLSHLIALETGHKPAPDTTRADAEDLLRFLNVRYIVVHPAEAGPDVIPYIESTLPVERFYTATDIVAYRVNLPAPPAEEIIDLGQPNAAARLAEGWGEAYVTDGYVWAQRDGAGLMVPLSGGAQIMSARIWAPGPRQVMTVDCNGSALPDVDLAEGWGDYQIAVPADKTKAGLNRLKLRFSRLIPVRQILPQGLPVGASNISLPANVLAKSAGKEVGDFGHIFLNGVDVSPEVVGYNAVALEPKTGQILAQRGFNTFASESASVELQKWVADLPEDTVVAVAVRDEASRQLTPGGFAALQSLGIQGDLRSRFRWSQAAIGVKGFAPGEALEDVQALRPATVKLGLGVTEPQVAAGFDWIKFSPAR
jgi:hypothetical protein